MRCRMVVACVTFVLAVWGGRARGEEARRPNVVVIMVDDLNDWVGCLGGHPDAKTPNIDRLAGRGVVFTNAHCAAPLCGPSRAALMSGMRPSTTGIYGQIKDEGVRGASEAMVGVKFLPEWFGERGYVTMGKGKLFHNGAPAGVFQEFGGRAPGFGPKPAERVHWKSAGTATDWGAFPERDEEMPDYVSARWAGERIARVGKEGKAYLMMVGFLRPHVPWHVPQSWYDLFPVEGVHTPPYLKEDLEDVPAMGRRVTASPAMPTTEWAIETGQWKEMVRAYLACVAFVDAQVGVVLDAIDASGEADRTIVVLMGDHGYHMGEKNRFAKHALWERATHTPLIVAGPGVAKGMKCGAPVGLIDLYPTLVEMCGLEGNPRCEGRSFVPLLSGGKVAWDRPALTTWGKGNHALRSARYRYIRYEDGSEELYDHETDPNEWTNIAGEARVKDVVEAMRKELPTENAPWAKGSTDVSNEYFRKTSGAAVPGGGD